MTDNSNASSSFSIVYDDIENNEGAKGLFSNSKQLTRKIGTLNADTLAKNFNDFCKQMENVFDNITESVKNYELQTVELSIDISAKGEVRFIGSLSSELKGGVKLTFSKKGEK